MTFKASALHLSFNQLDDWIKPIRRKVRNQGAFNHHAFWTPSGSFAPRSNRPERFGPELRADARGAHVNGGLSPSRAGSGRAGKSPLRPLTGAISQPSLCRKCWLAVVGRYRREILEGRHPTRIAVGDEFDKLNLLDHHGFCSDREFDGQASVFRDRYAYLPTSVPKIFDRCCTSVQSSLEANPERIGKLE